MKSLSEIKKELCISEKRMKVIDNIIGMKYGKLTITGIIKNDKNHVCYTYLCECGKTGASRHCEFNNIKYRPKSCGCMKSHGKSYSRIYVAWVAMLRRCNDKDNPNYKNYGAKGVKVCKKWSSFERFYKDMGDPKTGQSLDRINPYGNYEPSNCRWTDRSTQASNKRKRKNCSSKYIGVSFDKRRSKWTAQIGKDYKHYFIGQFDSEMDAARAYDRKSIELRGDLATLNFKKSMEMK